MNQKEQKAFDQLRAELDEAKRLLAESENATAIADLKALHAEESEKAKAEYEQSIDDLKAAHAIEVEDLNESLSELSKQLEKNENIPPVASLHPVVKIDGKMYEVVSGTFTDEKGRLSKADLAKNTEACKAVLAIEGQQILKLVNH